MASPAHVDRPDTLLAPLSFVQAPIALAGASAEDVSLQLMKDVDAALSDLLQKAMSPREILDLSDAQAAIISGLYAGKSQVEVNLPEHSPLIAVLNNDLSRFNVSVTGERASSIPGDYPPPEVVVQIPSYVPESKAAPAQDLKASKNAERVNKVMGNLDKQLDFLRTLKSQEDPTGIHQTCGKIAATIELISEDSRAPAQHAFVAVLLEMLEAQGSRLVNQLIDAYLPAEFGHMKADPGGLVAQIKGLLFFTPEQTASLLTVCRAIVSSINNIRNPDERAKQLHTFAAGLKAVLTKWGKDRDVCRQLWTAIAPMTERGGVLYEAWDKLPLGTAQKSELKARFDADWMLAGVNRDSAEYACLQYNLSKCALNS